MQNSKTFFLCTDSIEHSFAHTEVIQAAAHYQKVVLIVLQKTLLPLPANVNELVLSFDDFNAAKVLSQNKIMVGTILSYDILGRSFNWKYYKTSKNNLNYLLQSIFLSTKIDAFIQAQKIEVSNSVFVSFWFNTWAIALAVLKKQSKIPAFFSRAHGTDLFEYRVKITKRIPFRTFQLKWVNKVFSVSKNGENYLKETYPDKAQKVGCHYLGTADMGVNNFNPSATFTLVSCATVRNIKRIFLIPEILQQLNFQVNWIHLGDENLLAPDPTKERYLKNKAALKAFPKINAEFMGVMSNAQIFEFYKTTSVNLFISVSETEGLPVSIMEAISFGIPVMSTDVGGCSEIAMEQTGILIPKDFSTEKVAKQITEFNYSDKNTELFRNKVREFWASTFEVNKNYTKFFNDLEKL